MMPVLRTPIFAKTLRKLLQCHVASTAWPGRLLRSLSLPNIGRSVYLNLAEMKLYEARVGTPAGPQQRQMCHDSASQTTTCVPL